MSSKVCPIGELKVSGEHELGVPPNVGRKERYGFGSTLLTLRPNFPTSILRYSMSIVPAIMGLASILKTRSHGAVVDVMASGQAAIAFVAFAGILTWQTAPFPP